MVWEYFTHFHKSALCYTDVHVYRATSHCIFMLLASKAWITINGKDMIIAHFVYAFHFFRFIHPWN